VFRLERAAWDSPLNLGMEDLDEILYAQFKKRFD
jgi:hypothetical protein